MDNTFKKLHEAIQSNNTAQITKLLGILIKNETVPVLEVRPEDSEIFQRLLAIGEDIVVQLTANAIGEIAKTEPNRNVLSKELIIGPLLLATNSPVIPIKYQVCRAIGNICYENDVARSLLGTEGVRLIINVIKATIDLETDCNLALVSCGCLMNLINTNEELQKATLSYNVLGTVETVLSQQLVHFESNEPCITHLLIILNMVIEHMNDDWLSESFCGLLVKVLGFSVNPEISALCLEILQTQSENDDIKLSLAKIGTCQLVYELVEKHKGQVDDEDSRSMLKLACDLIVLILNGDAAMDLLYDNSNGTVYQQMIKWLESEDVDLLCTSIVAIGNFARNDNKCIQMVESGLARKLLDKLSMHNKPDGDSKVLYALLSALRNLSIPKENKSKLLNENLVEILLSMLEIEQSPVIFKLLGTLRMVIDGQEKTAIDLLTRPAFLDKLVYWCNHGDHLGIRGEAPRLLAWLIKNNPTVTSHHDVILGIEGSVACLVDMMSSMHTVMQNEALLALVLLSTNCQRDGRNRTDDEKCGDVDNTVTSSSSTTTINVSSLFVTADIGGHLATVLDRGNATLESPTVANMLVLVDQLCKSDVCVTHLRGNGGQVALSLGKLLPRHEESHGRRIRELCDRLTVDS